MVANLSPRGENGFTFIEMITVVLLISILATVAMLEYSGIQRQVKTDLVHADLKILRAAVRAYYMDHHAYPPDLHHLATEGYLEENPDDKFAPIGSKYKFDINALKISSIGSDGISDTNDDISIDFSF